MEYNLMGKRRIKIHSGIQIYAILKILVSIYMLYSYRIHVE